MEKDKERVETAEPRCRSERTPEGMLVVGRTSGKRKVKKAERLDGGTKVEADENDIGYGPRMMVVKIFNSVKEEPKKKKNHHCSLRICLRLMQKEQ